MNEEHEYEIWTFGDPSDTVLAASLEEALWAAESIVEATWKREQEADPDPPTKTWWVQATVAEVDGYDQDSVLVAIDPPIPECANDDNDHDWQAPQELIGGLDENPGVFSHGGSVVIHRVCYRCGTHRIEDDWAQDPESGAQGLSSIEYRVGEFADVSI